jgi:hypothetical protein
MRATPTSSWSFRPDGDRLEGRLVTENGHTVSLAGWLS